MNFYPARMNKTTKIFFPNLDGLRFIAFMFVFCEHVVWSVIKGLDIPKGSFLDHVLYNLFCNGGMGVSIFFVLSGFLITYLILKEIEMKGSVDVKAFYARRFLRIWPLYYAVLIFVFFLFPYVQHLLQIYQETCARPIYYFTFLSNFDLIHIARNCYDQGTPQSGVTWSVAIEEQFYLVWPLIFYFLPRQLYKYVFFLVILISLVFRVYHHADPSLIYFHTLGVVGDLAAGALLAYYSLTSERLLDFFKKLKNRSALAIYLLGIITILMSGFFITNPYYNALSRYVNVLFFVFVIGHQNFGRESRLKISRVSFISNWGKYTYGMYLLHPIAYIFGVILFKRIYAGEEMFLTDLTEAILILVITMLLSYFSYKYYESFFLKLKERFSYIKKE